MIGRVTEGQGSERTAAGPHDYQLDKASRGYLVDLLGAVVAAMVGCAVPVDAIVAVCEAENGIGYVRLQAVLEGKAA